MVMVDEAARREIAEQAKHNGVLEGLHVSPEQEIAIELWIRGQLDLDYMIEQTKQRYANPEGIK